MERIDPLGVSGLPLVVAVASPPGSRHKNKNRPAKHFVEIIEYLIRHRLLLLLVSVLGFLLLPPLDPLPFVIGQLRDIQFPTLLKYRGPPNLSDNSSRAGALKTRRRFNSTMTREKGNDKRQDKTRRWPGKR